MPTLEAAANHGGFFHVQPPPLPTTQLHRPERYERVSSGHGGVVVAPGKTVVPDVAKQQCTATAPTPHWFRPHPLVPAEWKRCSMAISDITDPGKTRKGPPCSVCEVLGKVPEDEATALRGLLADPTWRYSEISSKLDEMAGLDLPAFVLSRHARGKCAARERLR